MNRQSTAAAWLTPAAAFLLPAALWVVALALFGFYPFGERSILITDMGQQYIEYHAALYDTIKSGGSLLFTWNSGLGMNFVGLFAYYLSSPFTLLMFLFPRAAITEAVLLIISVKVAMAGLTFSLFLRRADVRGLTNVLFSTMYALSAYMVVYCFNIMWLDAALLLPLVILAVKHVVDTSKIAPLVAVLALLFFSNFYTAYMVGLFSLLVLATLLWLRGGNRWENLRTTGLFLGAAALAAGLTAFLMLPTFFALRDCQGTMAADSVFFGMMTDPLTLLGKLTWGAYDSVTDSGTPYLYSGVLTLGLLPVWIFHRGISRREKIAGTALIGVLYFSMLFSSLDYVWHAFETTVWFPCRYSFVFIFVLLTLAARAISRPNGLMPRHILAGFSSAAVLILAIKLPEWLFPKVCDTMTGSLWITLGALGVYALLSLSQSSRRLWLRRTMLGVLTICVCIELVGNTQKTFQALDKELSFENHADYAAFSEQSQRLRDVLAQAKAQEDTDEFYRVENSRARNANDGLSAGYHALSHYSSFSRRDTFLFLKNCGMVCTSLNKIFRYYGSTTALDAILGVRYVFSNTERRVGYVPTGLGGDDLVLWRNEYALPLAYFADSDMLTLSSEAQSPFAVMNRLLSSLDGQPTEYYSPLTVTADIENGAIEKFGTRTRITAQDNGVLSFTIHNPVRQNVMLYLNNNLSEFSAVYLDDAMLNPQSERLIRGVIDLGELPEGNAVVSLSVRGNTRWFSGLCAASFDEDAFGTLIDKLRENAPQKLSVSQTKTGEPLVTGQFIAPRDGVLFTSIPADCGWSAEIDGKTVKPVAAGGAFLTLPVTQGDHTFTLRFRPRGLAAGVAVSAMTAILCLTLLVITWVRRKREKHIPEQ